MKALLLNSGLGSRLGKYTENNPKSMVQIAKGETILSRQIKLLIQQSIFDIVITTGPYESLLKSYLIENFKSVRFTFIKNEKYSETNYIYSIYRAKDELQDDLILMHGDLVFEENVLKGIIKNETNSVVVVSSSQPLSDKDFKGVMSNGFINKIGIEYNTKDAMALQPLYKLYFSDWQIWLKQICNYCENGEVKCYAEKAFNDVSEKMCLKGYDIENQICTEIDNEEDLLRVRQLFKEY